MHKNLITTIKYLKSRKKILFITTSNRSKWTKEIPKSTQLAHYIIKEIGENKVTLFDIPEMNIATCWGDVSGFRENNCGVKKALLDDKQKNPSGFHRCWASFEKGDELRKISKVLFESDTILFFASVRRGQTNSMYQKLIERLTWIESRHTTFGEENIIKDIDAGIIVIGHNRNSEQVIETEKQVFRFMGFQTPKQLSRGRKFTDMDNESEESYEAAVQAFEKDFGFELKK